MFAFDAEMFKIIYHDWNRKIVGRAVITAGAMSDEANQWRDLTKPPKWTMTKIRRYLRKWHKAVMHDVICGVEESDRRRRNKKMLVQPPITSCNAAVKKENRIPPKNNNEVQCWREMALCLEFWVWEQYDNDGSDCVPDWRWIMVKTETMKN